MDSLPIPPDLVVPVLVALASGGLLPTILLLAWRRGRGRNDGMAALRGRLSQLAESQAAQQARLTERLQAQERVLTKTLDDRLGEVSKRIGDRLTESQTKQQEGLTDLRERLAVIDRAQQTITELSGQMIGLQDILANKQARGAFGEIQLRDIVATVLPPSAYEFQAGLAGGLRVDCLLKLPNPPGPIAIDAKFPLESYRLLREAKEEREKTLAARAFAADVRKHVRDIAKKYIVPGETAESALMFLPSEAVYAELHANFQAAIEESYRARVWIVSPTTLMATLNTVRAVLKDVRMREQAGVIQDEVLAMMKDVGRLDERVGRLQRHFDQAGEDIRQIRISAEKVSKRGERIEELQFEDEPDSVTPEPPKLRVAGD